MKRFGYLFIIFLALVSVGNRAQAQGISFTAPARSEIEQLWVEAEILARDGDSVAAVNEISRVERLMMKKYTKPEQKHEWLSIKARIYAFPLHNYDSACDIQIRACEAMKEKKKIGMMASPYMQLYAYEFFRGEFHLSYGAALMSYIEAVYGHGPQLANLEAERLVQACLALRRHREALSTSEWLLRQEKIRFYKSDPKYRWLAFSSLAKSVGLKVMSEVGLGYLDDAVRSMEWIDSLANSISAAAESPYERSEHYSYCDLPRIILLTAQQKYEEALEAASKYDPYALISILDNLHLFTPPYYYLLVSRIYSKMGKDMDALHAIDKAFAAMKQVNPRHPLMAEIMRSGTALLAHQNTTLAINMLGEAKLILDHCSLRQSDYYADVMELALRIGYKEPQLRFLLPRWVALTTLNRYNTLRTEFMECSSGERLLVWKNGPYKSLFEDFLPRLLCENADLQRNDTLMVCTYSGIQTVKSILLSSDQRIRQLVRQHADHSLVDSLDCLMRLKDELYHQGGAAFMQYDFIRKRIYSLEQTITQKLHLYDDQIFSRNLKLQGTYLNRMQPESVYIDFVHYPMPDGEIRYAAFVAYKKKGVNCIEGIPLCLSSELSAANKGDIYANAEVYDMLWKGIDKACTQLGFRNIYFSPSGILHNMAIEYVPDSSGRSMSDKFNVYRVLSTRETIAADHHARRNAKRMDLWGDMDFSSHCQDTLFSRLSTRLPFSRMEVDGINTNLPHHIRARLYTGKAASETAFKGHDSRKTDILHISTHGCYWNEEFVARHSAHPLLKEQRADAQSRGEFTSEDRSMKHSVLLFTKYEDKTTNDGVLTATEIAMMDFSHVDLVTLSACQTALGDLSSEGTLGLQRAFKKAGAKSLLISLKPVNDESTFILMTHFYKYLFQGKTKHEALRMAQQEVKTIAHGMFAHPRYWAPFILVDALD